MSIAREEDLKNAQSRVDELESQLSQMHDSFEIAVAHLEKARDEAVKNVDILQDELADRDTEIANANKDIDALGRNVYDLEEELEHLKKRHEQELGTALDRTLEAEDEIKALRRKLAEVERSLGRDIEDKTRVSDVYPELASHLTSI